MNSDQRPDPDRLLAMVQHDRSVSMRGRLKIFFGASAGVGKTYAMLQEARRRLAEGIDVVSGVVETHGRSETAALIDGIPAIPLRTVAHRGVSLHEFDLEAALARKPALILMDEFAHNNAPGSRHPKRWQDVEELLNNGIDVYTTLNVQHLDSLNDMVAKLTGILVRETVPDRMFDLADDIALIDIPSDELLKRLSEGKVYIAPDAGQKAAENFFKKTNLLALRELALRRTAERVDAQMDVLIAAQGQREAQTGQKILICIGHDALSARVIRHARRMAARAKAPWYAIYVQTGRHERLNDHARLTADRNLRLAEKMGAKIVRVSGNTAADEILRFARDNGITRVVVGHARQRPLPGLGRYLVHDLIDRGAGLEITTVVEDLPREHAYMALWRHLIDTPSRYAYGLGIIAICTAVGLPFRGLTDANNLTMIYLTGVVMIAARFGTGPSVLASLLSIAAFNFFYTVPYYTFSFIDPDYYFTFSVMLVTSLLVGSLAAKLALQARQARQREIETHALYVLTRELSSVRGIPAMASVATDQLAETFQASAAIFLAAGDTLHTLPVQAHDFKEENVARWVITNGQVAGRHTDTMPSARWLYFPLVAEGMVHGALGLIPKTEAVAFTTAQISQLETFASLIASAFQRAKRADEAEAAQLDTESEKLRNVLLSSVSHDLRTPLASITGAASSALMLRDQLPGAVVDLLGSIHNQAARLAKLVTNLLDVTSLEAGKVRLNCQPYYIAEVIGSALARVETLKGDRVIAAHIVDGLPLAEFDGLLIEQVLVNLLENAIRYTPENGAITVAAEMQNQMLIIHIRDTGTGLTPGDEARIFEKFYTRGHRPDGNVGLGLAICKGIIEAHGGQIRACNTDGGGAQITFTLPIIGPMSSHDLDV